MIQRSSNSDALQLTTRKSHTALADHRIQPLRQAVDELFELRRANRTAPATFVDLIVRQTKRNVPAQRIVGEKDCLRNITDLVLPAAQVCPNVHGIDPDRSAARLQQSEYDIDQRALSGTTFSDETHSCTSEYSQTDPLQSRPIGGRVAKTHVVERQVFLELKPPCRGGFLSRLEHPQLAM